jgi:hypothetical protein
MQKATAASEKFGVGTHVLPDGTTFRIELDGTRKLADSRAEEEAQVNSNMSDDDCECFPCERYPPRYIRTDRNLARKRVQELKETMERHTKKRNILSWKINSDVESRSISSWTSHCVTTLSALGTMA